MSSLCSSVLPSSALPSSMLPSAASCELLMRLKTLSWSFLFDLALQYYEGEEDRAILQNAISGFLDEPGSQSPSHQLAELLYFHYGHRIAATNNQVKQLTVAQAQHEILVRGLLTRKELTDDIDSLCSTLIDDNMSILEKPKPFRDSGDLGNSSPEKQIAQPEPRDEEGSDEKDKDEVMDEDDSSEDDSDEEDPGQDNGQSPSAIGDWRDNGGYIRSWNPKLQRCVQYRF
ncbi:hypothetical protein DM02DRAFT_649987 [Periconia macrospinosa]|uniref:Uncharacterized protein n=1 Tax=Periconia macrospinosa TaxID=97972 RepID=A0A2V1E6V1_9PLEO|nr:hypothetical protein DM02DRAFT_649987 [Periconia macrospinosa]